MIAPVFEGLSKQYTNVNFLKCDVDAAAEVSGRYRVTAMWTMPTYIRIINADTCVRPTFVFLRGSTEVDRVRGANQA